MNLLDKILKLNDLGYSKAEIDALLAIPEKEEVIDIEDAVQVIEPEVKIEEAKEDDPTIARLTSIEETLKAMQKENIMKSNMPTVEEKTELEIVQEILGGIKPNGNE